MGDRARGRPRSERAHRAVLEATRDLVAESGFDRLSIERIAQRAGVGKHTVYRWWPSKSAVVAEAFREGYLRIDTIPIPQTGDLASDLREWMRAVLLQLGVPTNRELVRALVVSSGDIPVDEIERLYGNVIASFRTPMLHRLGSAQRDGQARADADADALVEAFVGVLLYHVLTQAADPLARADALVDLVIAGLGPRPRRARARRCAPGP